MKTKTRGKNRVSGLSDMFKVSMNMTYKDLKRNCVVRGMEFSDVVDGTVPKLQNWLHHNTHNDIDSQRLNEFDDWIENILKERGKEELIHPQLRLGYIGEKDEETGKPKIKKVKGIKKKKPQREKTTDGIFKGTKKALTFQLQQEGISVEDTIEKVMEQFPEASPKSIKIWWKKSLKLHKS